MRAAPVTLGAALFCGLLGPGCGKKGPPLAPIVRIPAAVEQVSARRVGDDVYITLTVPSQNIDASMPADVRRVDVYAATAMTPPPRGRFLEIAALIDTVFVAPSPAAPVDPRGPSTAEGADRAAVQGAMVTVRDVLSPADLVARNLPVRAADARRPALPPAGETPRDLRRFYLAVAFSARGRPGPPGAIAELRLTVLPEPPAEVEVGYTSESVSVAWQPSGGLLGFLLNQALPIEGPPFDDIAPGRGPTERTTLVPEPGARRSEPAVVGPTRYNVYRELAPDPLQVPATADRSSLVRRAPEAPTPLNPSPLDALMFVDELEFERERCYVIRAVRGTGSNLIEGHPSQRRCLTPIDVFPPAAPAGLSAVAAAGAISLIWEASTDVDVAGYLILRGGSVDATLLPLTNVPIADTQFVDRDVTAGERYVYAVVAVDSRVPLPNVSVESMRVEETAR